VSISYHVVIAEDQEVSRCCRAELEELSFTVTECGRNGNLLLETIGRERPAAVICAASLSGVDALGVMERCKGQNAPLFYVTSPSDLPAIRQALLEGGADEFLLKPFDARFAATQLAKTLGIPQRQKPAALPRTLEIRISELLHRIGVPAHIKGYHYLREAIRLSVTEPRQYQAVTKTLYPEIAQRFRTTPSRVERAIRHAIEVAWDRGDVDVLCSIFGYTVNHRRGKPTNSEFIAMLSDGLLLEDLSRTAV